MVNILSLFRDKTTIVNVNVIGLVNGNGTR
ncbi:unnamed protein product, partial [Rotaria sordida]